MELELSQMLILFACVFLGAWSIPSRAAAG